MPTLEKYTETFIRQLHWFAVDYRSYGRYGCDRKGALRQVRATADHDGISPFYGLDDALRVCRELAAEGHRAFEV